MELLIPSFRDIIHINNRFQTILPQLIILISLSKNAKGSFHSLFKRMFAEFFKYHSTSFSIFVLYDRVFKTSGPMSQYRSASHKEFMLYDPSRFES